jgi:hypothetical protein
VTKEQTPPRDTTAMMPPVTPPVTMPATTDSTVRTVTVDTTVTRSTITTTTSGGEAIPMPQPPKGKHFGNGFYFGLAGGASFPQNELNNAYHAGYSIEVPVGWDPPNSPVGLRLNLGYNELRTDGNIFTLHPDGTSATVQNAKIWQGELDAKFTLPFRGLRGGRSGLYAIGGGGAYYFDDVGIQVNAQPTPTPHEGDGANQITSSAEVSSTRFGANVGGGFSFGIGPASLYVESRYLWVFHENDRKSNYIPVVLGVTFH